MTDKSDVPQKKKTEYKKKDSGGWKKIGAQVGNALTNAATLLPEGSSASDLEAMAWDIIQVGERLKTKLKDFRDKPKAAPKPVESAQDWGDEAQEDLIDDDVDGMDW